MDYNNLRQFYRIGGNTYNDTTALSNAGYNIWSPGIEYGIGQNSNNITNWTRGNGMSFIPEHMPKAPQDYMNWIMHGQMPQQNQQPLQPLLQQNPMMQQQQPQMQTQVNPGMQQAVPQQMMQSQSNQMPQMQQSQQLNPFFQNQQQYQQYLQQFRQYQQPQYSNGYLSNNLMNMFNNPWGGSNQGGYF